MKIPVNSGYLLWNDVIFGTFKGTESIKYKFPQGTEHILWDSLGPDEVQVQVTVSGSPFLRMGQGLKYLLKYPYGCVEQTSSGVLALAALRGLIHQGLIPGISMDETDKFLKKGIERILNMQTDSGGFGYWPGNIRPDRWGTLYAATALTFAHRSGYPVPVDRMSKAMAYLEEQVKKSRFKFKDCDMWIPFC